MLKTLRIESVRARLTLWYVSVLAAALVLVGVLIYVLLARALYVRVDANLQAAVRIAMTSLSNDLAEGQDYQDAARSTAAELSSSEQMLAIYDGTAGCWPRAAGTATSSSIATGTGHSGRRGAAADRAGNRR